MDRQRGQVGLVAGQHDLLRGRLGARHLDDLGLVAQPALDFGDQCARLDAEGAREPGAAAGHVGDQLLPLRADGAEQHGARIAFERRRDVGEVERLVVSFKLAVGRLSTKRRSRKRSKSAPPDGERVGAFSTMFMRV